MHFEERACEEIAGLLDGLGDDGASARPAGFTGIITARTSLDPVEAVSRIAAMIRDEPWSVRYCLRIIPVQRAVRATEEAITAEAGYVAGMIPEGCTYRIRVKRRGSKVSTTALIRGLASRIPRGVDLERPDRDVLVEIIGGTAGISVLEGGALSVHDEKRRASEEGGALGQ
ncbi:MAG: THUMP domain-containing protein [Nitrosopumilus sp.]|nr:THUMP domain-containing protein [Nitrosopumilus sp.]